MWSLLGLDVLLPQKPAWLDNFACSVGSIGVYFIPNIIAKSFVMSKFYTFTKTSFVRGMQCRKLVYLDKYCSKLRTPPDKETLLRFRKGREFEQKFKDLFPNAVDVKKHCSIRSIKYVEFTNNTLSAEGKIELFEAGILYSDILVLTDVLRKNEDGTYDVFEVKHSEKINSAIAWDLAVQYYVCKNALGDNIHSFNVVNRCGEDEFVITDMTAEVEAKLKVVHENLDFFREILQGFEPDVPMGTQCDEPYVCDFKRYCMAKADCQYSI